MTLSTLDEKVARARRTLDELSGRLPEQPEYRQEKIAEELDRFSAFVEECLHAPEGRTEPQFEMESERALPKTDNGLQEKIAELEATLEAVPALVWISRDRECREMFGSRSGYEFLGMSKVHSLSRTADENNLKLQHYRNYKNGQEIPGDQMPMQIAAKTGRSFMDYEFDIVFDDGRTYSLLGNVIPLLDHEGNPRGAVGAFMDITERKQAEEKQQERQAQESERTAELQAIIDAVPAPMFISRDPQGVNIIGNRATYEMVNLPPGTNLSRLLTGALPGEMQRSLHDGKDIETQEAPIYRVLRTGERIENYEARLQFSDGRDVMLLGTASPIFSAAGDILGSVSVFMDITARKAAEEALRLNAERNAYRIQLADALRRQTDAEQIKSIAAQFLGEKLGASRVFYATISENAEEVNIEPWYARGIEPLAGHFRFADFHRDLERDHPNGRPFVLQDVFTDPRLSREQRAAYLSVNVKAHVDVPLIVNGKFVALFSANQNEPRDWTEEEISLIVETAERTWASVERAQTLKELRESETRFRESIESLLESFLLYRAVRELRPDGKPGSIRDMRIEYANAAAHRINRRQPGEMEGQTLLEIFPNTFGRQLFDRYCKAIDTGEPLLERVQLGETPETARIYDIHAVPMGDSLVVTRLDVTEEVKLGRERQNALTQMEIQRRLSEQSEKDRQNYARELHDGPIQTLASIAYQLQFIKEEFETPGLAGEVGKIDASLRTAIQELRQVINELRPPSAIRHGLAKAIQQHAEEITDRRPGIKWSFSLPEEEADLPPVYTLALYRIYQESTNNIIRHSRATRARVRYYYTGNHIILDIRDNGVGMAREPDPDELTRTGHFGLAGIRERAETIGGELKITSEPGKGTRVRVTVPCPE